VKRTLHDVRNQLAVAVANVEAMRDGVIDPSRERFETVLAALAHANELLHQLNAVSPPAADGDATGLDPRP
jgi:hypothetical protein